MVITKLMYCYLTISLATTFAATATNAQNPDKQDHILQGKPSQNDVTIKIIVTRPNLLDATNEANDIQATMPKALYKIFHKDVHINYASSTVTTKKIGKASQYQVTVAGSGKSR